MFNQIVRLFVGGALFGLLAVAPLIAHAAPLSERISGRIVLQVQEKGKAWYINPATQERAYLGRPGDAFRIMRELGLGITTADLERIAVSDDSNPGDTKLARRLAGKILLQVQAAGEAWYINPVDLKRYYLGRPSDAFSVMRNLGLGVSNADIEKISVAEKYADPEQTPVSQTQTALAEEVSALKASQPAEKTESGTNSQTKLSQTPQNLSAYAGSYRCRSYNVSGGGGGDCRLFAPIVLNSDGTYSVSSEKGTFMVSGDTIVLSESKIRGQGKLIGGTQIRFEYDYNNWHHVITYLKESSAAQSSTEKTEQKPKQQPSEVTLFLILEYPEKDSGLSGISYVELVPEGETRQGARYKPDAAATWDRNKRISAYFHTLSAPQTGKNYTIYTTTGFGAAWPIGTIDLTNAMTTIKATMSASLSEVSVLPTAKLEEIYPSTAAEIVVDIDLVYPEKDSSLRSIRSVTLVPEGEDPFTAFYQPYSTALWDGNRTVMASFVKELNRVRTGIKYTIYTDWGFFNVTPAGTLDLTNVSSGPIKRTYQTTIPASSSDPW